jgi:hypothetical protein
MELIKTAVLNGRPSVTDIVPGTVLRHFLYKSRGNLQYVMPTYEPHFATMIDRRRCACLQQQLQALLRLADNLVYRLLSLYSRLQSTVQAKMSHLKVYHCVEVNSMSLAWVTPMFELYCVAGPNVPRNALAQGANKVVQWVRREEERIFIIGGAVSLSDRLCLFSESVLANSILPNRFSKPMASLLRSLFLPACKVELSFLVATHTSLVPCVRRVTLVSAVA